MLKLQAYESGKTAVTDTLALLIVILLLFVPVPSLLADAVMYMDESGNINFAEHISQIPVKYRSQVQHEPEVVSELTPVEYRRAYVKQVKAQEKAQVLAERRKKREELLAKRKQLKLQRKQKLNAKKQEILAKRAERQKAREE